MWQSIPRTGSLLLRASRPHSVQRFTRCLLSSLHASLPASSGFLLPPLLPPCLAPCVQRFPAASSPPSMPRSQCPAVSCCLLSSLHALLPALSGLPAACFPPSMPRSLRSAVSPLPALSSLHASLPASSGLPAVPLSSRPRVTPTKAQQNLLTT